MDFSTIIGFLLGGSFLGFIEFLLRRYDSKHDRFESIVKEIANIRQDLKRVEEKGDKREAIASRVRILRFSDELQDGRRHSKDSFDQVLSDITEYEHYCAEHPLFKNNQTEATVSHIKRCYAERLERRDFA